MQGSVRIREATPKDIPAVACLRGARLATEEQWRTRIAGYMDGTHHPQKALAARVLYVACEDDTIVGLIAGHLTTRFDCDGELQWIDVAATHQRHGIASALVGKLAHWFISQNAKRICVDVEPSNASARAFYANLGARDLKPSWMVWEDISACPAPKERGGSADGACG